MRFAAAVATPRAWRWKPLRRIGTVVARDVDGCRVRVKFEDRDDVVSYWLGVLVPKTRDDKFYVMPDIGEQVVCLLDERLEDGEVLGARYSTADAPVVADGDVFSIRFKDGTVMEYNRATHKATVNNGSGEVEITAATGVTINADVTINGNVAVDGAINSTGDQVAAGISQTGHKHGGVQSGGSLTDLPQ